MTTTEIEKFVENTRGGVIFFSTKGKRSSADMMSGGDFDGDIYKIIYNKEILKYITTSDFEPLTADIFPTPSVTPQKLPPLPPKTVSRNPSFTLPTPTKTEHEIPSYYYSVSTPSTVDSVPSKLEFEYEGVDTISLGTGNSGSSSSSSSSSSSGSFIQNNNNTNGKAVQPKNVYTIASSSNRSSVIIPGSNHAKYAHSITPSKSTDSSYNSPPRRRINSVFHKRGQDADATPKSVFDGMLFNITMIILFLV